MSNDLKHLLQREIYDIFIGDRSLEINEKDTVKMPYYSAQDLKSLLVIVGTPVTTLFGSRWTYMEYLLGYAIKTNKIEILLGHLFDFENFKHHLRQLKILEEKKKVHIEIVQIVITKINKYFIFSNIELRTLGDDYKFVNKNSSKKIESEILKIIDLKYIHELSRRIQADLDENKFDSVLGKSRTLVEEILIYILEQKQESNIPKGDFVKLFSQVKICLNMQQCREFDKRINAML